MRLTPLLFDGSLDQAETWLAQFIFVLNRRGELVEAEMEDDAFSAFALIWRARFDLVPMSDTMGLRRFKIAITTQLDGHLRTSDLGHILMTPLPKSTKLELATLESRRTREAVERFWGKLREHMQANAVLIERVPEAQQRPAEPEPDEEWWVDQVDREDVQYIQDWRTLKGDTKGLMSKWGLLDETMVYQKSSRLRGKYKKKLGDKTGLEIIPTKKTLLDSP